MINSEVAKKREALQRRLDNVRRWADGAGPPHAQRKSSCTSNAVNPTCERADALYRVLGAHQMELVQQGVENFQARQTIKEEKTTADAEIEE